MAMSFAVAGLALAGVEIEDPACVSKTYPGFFGDLARLAGRQGPV
jgi:3-phosphoshikimate 1-carboxyvinyltransferase